MDSFASYDHHHRAPEFIGPLPRGSVHYCRSHRSRSKEQLLLVYELNPFLSRSVATFDTSTSASPSPPPLTNARQGILGEILAKSCLPLSSDGRNVRAFRERVGVRKLQLLLRLFLSTDVFRLFPNKSQVTSPVRGCSCRQSSRRWPLQCESSLQDNKDSRFFVPH